MADLLKMLQDMDAQRGAAVPPTSPGFYTQPRGIPQMRALRAAETENVRTERQLLGAGVDVQGAIEAEEPGWSSTLLTPIFDMLQIGQFVSAGAALELQKNGLGWDAYKRAGVEFANALPFVDIEEAGEIFGFKYPAATRPAYEEFIKKLSPEIFDKSGAGRWSAAIGGTLLDIFLDPITYVGGVGLLKKIPAVARGALALKTAAGGTKWGASFGRKFVKGFDITQYGRKHPKLVESAAKFLENQRMMDIEITIGQAEIRNTATHLAAGMTIAEQRLMATFFADKDKLKEVLKLAARNDDEYAELVEKADAFADAFTDVFEKDVKAELLDNAVFRSNYITGMYPIEGSAGDKAIRELFERMGIEPERVPWLTNQGELGIRGQIGQGVPSYAKAKTYPGLEERTLAAVPTELNIGVVYARRASESVRRAASKRLIDATLSDPMIARRLKDVDLERAVLKNKEQIMAEVSDPVEAKRLYEMAQAFERQIQQEGFGIYRPLRKEWKPQTPLGELKKGDMFGYNREMYKVTEKIRDGGVAARKIEGKKLVGETVEFPREWEMSSFTGEPLYVMPKPFINELDLAGKIYRGETSEARKFMQSLMTVQNIWKGYAVLSPGFHMRNMFSNIWLNTLGGVDNPVDYIRALRLQRGKGDDIAIKVGNEIVQGQALWDLARKWGIIGTGPVSKEFGLDAEKELLANLAFKRSGADIAGRIRSGPGLDEVLEMAGGGTITRKEFAALIAETSPGIDIGAIGSRLLGKENWALQVNRRFGEAIENNAKLTHFINKLERGLSPAEAAKSAKKYLYSYNELTNFEKDVMRFFVPFYCVPDDCEILTQEGWKKVDELRVGENVLSMDHSSQISEWVALENISVFDYNGVMLTIGGKLDKYEFTPDHRWPVEYMSHRPGLKGEQRRKIVRGYELHTNYKIPRVSKYYVGGDTSITPRMAAILGWLVTDGHMRVRAHSPNHVEMVIYQSPKKYLKNIMDLLGDDGHPDKPHPDTGVVAVRITGELRKQIQNILPRKTDIVTVVCRMTRSAAKACLQAMLDAEASFHEKSGIQFVQKPGPVMDAFQIVAQLSGHVVHISGKDDIKRSYLGSRTHLKVITGYGHSWYKGRIWCPTTKHGTWLMRRNGRVIWTGNSWMRFNIPNMFVSMLEKPGRFAALSAKPIQAIESLSADWRDIPTPDYFEEIRATRLPKGISEVIAKANEIVSGAQQSGIQPTFLNPNFPFQDINHLNVKDVMSSMTPIFKIPIELISGEQGRGYSFFMDRPIERYPGEPTEISAFPGVEARLPRTVDYAARGIMPTYGKMQRMREAYSRGQLASQMLTEVFGIKVIQVDIDRVNRAEVYKRQSTLRALKQKARELGMIP